LLANRMAEIQASPINPDASKEDKIDTGYGIVKLIQKSTPEEMEEPDNTVISGITRVTLDAAVDAQRGAPEQTVGVLCLPCGLSARADALSPSSRSP
jgi:hypothetical protein